MLLPRLVAMVTRWRSEEEVQLSASEQEKPIDHCYYVVSYTLFEILRWFNGTAFNWMLLFNLLAWVVILNKGIMVFNCLPIILTDVITVIQCIVFLGRWKSIWVVIIIIMCFYTFPAYSVFASHTNYH